MSDFIVQGPKSDDRDSSRLKNGLFPLEKALAEAGLTTKNVHFVEVVGSGSRVPAIIKIITEFFGKEPRRTMNASECVARGCALQCAILSPTFKVREFQVFNSLSFYIVIPFFAVIYVFGIVKGSSWFDIYC